MTVNTTDLQYIWCAVCLEVQREMEANGQTPNLAITFVDGTAVCEEHRRRVNGFTQAVLGARRYHTRDSNDSYPRRRT